jgi:hypothetical protein
MKKKEESIYKSYPSVVLYLDDIIYLVTLLANNGFKRIEVVAGENVYESQEIFQLQELDHFNKIITYEPFYVSISLSDTECGVDIFTENNSLLAEGIIIKLERFFLAKKRNKSLFSLIEFKNISISF